MNRAQRRQDAKDQRAAKWRNLSASFRGMAGSQLLAVADRAALRDAANRLDRGERPLVVTARISATLARVDAITKDGKL